jgi:hypothetical protein
VTLTLLITGSRWWGRPYTPKELELRGVSLELDDARVARERKIMLDSLSAVARNYDSVVLVEGMCKGADTLAMNIGDMLGFTVRGFPYIGSLGRAGGVVRNDRMVEFTATAASDSRQCYAYHADMGTSRGTKDCWQKARRARLKTTVFR